MSTFAVIARRITLQPIENADRLELASIDGTEFMAVVQKGLHASGALIVYIPEQSILPDSIIEEMGLISEDGKTMLAGGTVLADGSKKRDRVKALRLRGTLSQGLVYSHTEKLGELVEGEDYSEALGVTKYEPPIPSEMSGRVEHKPGLYSYTDIENIKYFPQVLSEDEEVVASEKIHGSCTILCRFPDGEFVVSSKGLASKQLALITERNSDGVAVNIYHRVGEAFGISTILDALSERWPGQTLTLFGETLGVQDLMYGLPKGELDLKFFDLRVGDRYLDYDEFVSICQEFDLPRPNELYRGPYDRVKLEEVASGREQVTGKEVHLREGVVVRPAHERRDNELGRVILKVISPAYLTKRGDEATEFE